MSQPNLPWIRSYIITRDMSESEYAAPLTPAALLAVLGRINDWSGVRIYQVEPLSKDGIYMLLAHWIETDPGVLLGCYADLYQALSLSNPNSFGVDDQLMGLQLTAYRELQNRITEVTTLIGKKTVSSRPFALDWQATLTVETAEIEAAFSQWTGHPAYIADTFKGEPYYLGWQLIAIMTRFQTALEKVLADL